MKYVPKILGTFKYVPNVPNIRYILGTKTSPTPFGIRSSFREGRSFLLVFSIDGVRGQMKKMVKK